MGLHPHIGGGLTDAVVHNRLHLGTQRQHVGRIDHCVGVLVFAGAAKDQANGARVVNAELTLQTSGRRFLAGQLQHQRVHFDRHFFDVVSCQAVLFAQLHAAVDAGVNHDAAGKGLVGVEGDLPAVSQLVGDLRPVGLSRKHLHQPAWRL